jgi:uncharacterized membrane-anchored protein
MEIMPGMPIVYSTLNHPLRVPLAAEIHSRPPMTLEAPERITHFAIYGRNDIHSSSDNAAVQLSLLAALCTHFGVTAPSGEAKYFFYDFGRFRLKWECHTEFASYTFVAGNKSLHAADAPFSYMPLSDLPEEWLLSLRGLVMVASHVVLERATESSDAAVPQMRRLFEGNAIVGCDASQAAQVWTDFLIHADGFGRFVVRDNDLYGHQAGRLVQRLLEIETYRMMALLGLPYAQRANPSLNAIEAELATLTVAMVGKDKPEGGDSEIRDPNADNNLLQQITALAARLERLTLDNSYRFSASQAYFRLVNARIEELRERRIEGVTTVSEFMVRRLTPAMSTCAAVARRQEVLSERIANTNSLLRTRVGIVQEQQNSKILESMNTRAAQQLRLQQAVEGLSVVAISYYLAGLISYAGKAVKAAGFHIDTDLTTGLAVPLLALFVWMGLRRLHKKVTH